MCMVASSVPWDVVLLGVPVRSQWFHTCWWAGRSCFTGESFIPQDPFIHGIHLYLDRLLFIFPGVYSQVKLGPHQYGVDGGPGEPCAKVHVYTQQCILLYQSTTHLLHWTSYKKVTPVLGIILYTLQQLNPQFTDTISVVKHVAFDSNVFQVYVDILRCTFRIHVCLSWEQSWNTWNTWRLCQIHWFIMLTTAPSHYSINILGFLIRVICAVTHPIVGPKDPYQNMLLVSEGPNIYKSSLLGHVVFTYMVLLSSFNLYPMLISRQ